MLTFYSYICYLKYIKNISNKEFSFFQYDIDAVCEKSQVQLYLWDLFKIAKLANSSFCYLYLVHYLASKGIVDIDKFTDWNSANTKYVDEYKETCIQIEMKQGMNEKTAKEKVEKKTKKYLIERRIMAIQYQHKQKEKRQHSGLIRRKPYIISSRTDTIMKKLLK